MLRLAQTISVAVIRSVVRESGASVLVLLLLAAAIQSSAAAFVPYQHFRVGNSANVRVSPRPGFALIGGGKDLDAAFQWLCERSRGGDLLILHASGTDIVC